MADRVAAALVVRRRVSELVESIKTLDPLVRQDRPDSVHDLRVATRRLRSILATFRPLLDREATDPLRDELRWIAQLLGEARDSEVLRERLLRRIAREPQELVVGPIVQRVDQQLGDQYREAHARTVQAMESDRYSALIEGLAALVASPPWTPLADQADDRRLRRCVQQDWKRVRAAVASVPTDDPDQRDRGLHEVRKAAKRARYAAEALEPLDARNARRFAKANERVQSVLGDHNDSVVARQALFQLAEQARSSGEATFSYGRLHALEQAEAVVLRDDFARIWRKASRRKLRRWLE